MEERSLKDKVVVITGGAMGIGYQIADNYMKQGAVTIILDIDSNKGEEAVKELNTKYGENRSVFIKCDVTTDLEVVSKQILNTYKFVDVLVNNAGLSDHNWKKCLEVNVNCLVAWAMKFWDHMRKDKNGKGGTILNLASIYSFRVEPFMPVYQASKFAVLGFTRALGHPVNFERSGVRVVALCPGYTNTAIGTHRDDSQIEYDEFFRTNIAEHLKVVPWQEPEVVGAAAVEIFEKGDTGSAWLIEGGKPLVEVL